MGRYGFRPPEDAVKVRIGDIEFDRVSYDEHADVLYLHVGDPDTATDFDASAEGHALRYDDLDRLVGITIVGPRLLMREEGRVLITRREGRLEASLEELSKVIASPAA